MNQTAAKMQDHSYDPRVQALTAALAEAKSDVSRLIEQNKTLEADVEIRNLKIRELNQRLQDSEKQQVDLHNELDAARDDKAIYEQELVQAKLLIQTMQNKTMQQPTAEQGHQHLTARGERNIQEDQNLTQDRPKRKEKRDIQEDQNLMQDRSKRPMQDQEEQRYTSPRHEQRQNASPKQDHSQLTRQDRQNGLHDRRQREPDPQHEHRAPPPYRMPGHADDDSDMNDYEYPPERGRGGLPRKRMNHESSSAAPVILHRSAVVKSAKQAPPLSMGSLGAGENDGIDVQKSAQASTSASSGAFDNNMQAPGQGRPPPNSQSSHQGHPGSHHDAPRGMARSQKSAVLPTNVQNDGYYGDESGGEADVVQHNGARRDFGKGYDRGDMSSRERDEQWLEEQRIREEQKRVREEQQQQWREKQRARKVQQLRNPNREDQNGNPHSTGKNAGVAAGSVSNMLGMRGSLGMNKKQQKSSSVMTVAESSMPGSLAMRRGEHPVHDAGQVGTPPGSSGSSKPGSRGHGGGLLSRGLGTMRGRMGGMRSFVGTPRDGTRPGSFGGAKVGASVVPMAGSGLVGTNPTHPEEIDIFDF